MEIGILCSVLIATSILIQLTKKYLLILFQIISTKLQPFKLKREEKKRKRLQKQKNFAHIANYCKEQLYSKRNIKSMTVQRTLFELNLYGFNSLNYRDYVRLDDFIRFLNFNLKIRDKIYKVFFSICKFFWKILIR